MGDGRWAMVYQRLSRILADEGQQPRIFSVNGMSPCAVMHPGEFKHLS
jgi:hypothetical protein